MVKSPWFPCAEKGSPLTIIRLMLSDEEESPSISSNVLPDYYMKAGAQPPVFPVEWKRKQIENPSDISFCVIDLDYRTGRPNAQYDSRREGEVAVVDLHGVDMEGRPVLCHCHDFKPYFYSSIPPGFTADMIEDFKNKLNSEVGQLKGSENAQVIQKIEIVNKRSIMFYHKDPTQRFLRIETLQPKCVATCRNIIEEGRISMPINPHFQYQTYESNVDFIIRFMDDNNITGCSWVTAPKGTYSVRPVSQRTSISQFEIDINYKSLISNGTDDEWMAIPPLKILSFDIEVGGAPDHFPTADKDPVIQICCYVATQGKGNYDYSVAFVLDTCTKVVGSALFQFEKEEDLLIAFKDFIQYVDPDIITGYNINGFDMPYLVDRANAIKKNQFCELGRYKGEMSKASDVVKNTKALGSRDTKEVNVPGRIQYDMMVSIMQDHKLRSYSLNAVSSKFLGDQKEDVHYSMISQLQAGTATDRHRLAIYCIKDAYLPLQLMNKLLSILTSVELARVCHVPINYLLNRGQQIRVFSQILSKANERGMIVPAVRSTKADDKYQGATVIEPKTGWYTTPIPTLDFNSLYPSIMIAHNLCYSTLLQKPDPSIDYETSPNGVKFVSHDTFPGVLPEILKNLLSSRKKAKADMANAKDPMLQQVFNKRQLALKVSANSVYGFTGATVGKLPCLDISETVTAYGRTMIMKTKELVEEKYTIANGYSDNATVIYGDTDSVMVNFGNITLKEAIERGIEAAAYVSDHFEKPIHLDFEKAYMPYLLIAKKHYAGLLHTNAEHYAYIDAKGIESVRRDNCRLVQGLVQRVLDLLLINMDPGAAERFVKKIVSDLVADRIDLSFLVISKALSKKGDQYKGKQAHVELAERMAKRDPGSAPRMGDRIPYVICDGLKNMKAFEKSEDPIWVLENGLHIDTKYYLENQLSGPLERLFGPIIGIEKVKSLMEGEHTQTVKRAPIRETNKKKSAGTLLGFVKIGKKCICGKTSVADNAPPVCDKCKGRVKDVYQEKMNMKRYAEEEFTKLWTQCQRCQGSFTNPNICTARDCPIFYRRKKVQLELEDTYKAIARFDDMPLE